MRRARQLSSLALAGTGVLLVVAGLRLLAKVVVAVAASIGAHYVFEDFLRVPLPYASVSALRSLGF